MTRPTPPAILLLTLAGLLTAGCGVADRSSPTSEPEIPTAPPMTPGDPPPAPAEQGPTDADAPEEFTTTGSGLKYRILRKSDGPKPTPSDTVTVNYRGWLDSGEQFDSSYERGEPTTFPLNGVIAGWTEGLQYVSEGGMIELEIPGPLAYPEGRPGIPPGATLHFIVELIQIN